MIAHCTGTSIKSDRVKLVLWAQTSLLGEILQACKCIPHVSKMSTLTYKRANRVIIRYYKERYYLEHYTDIKGFFNDILLILREQ